MAKRQNWDRPRNTRAIGCGRHDDMVSFPGRPKKPKRKPEKPLAEYPGLTWTKGRSRKKVSLPPVTIRGADDVETD